MNESLCVCIVGLGRVGNTLAFLLKELGYKSGDIITKEQNDYGKTLMRVLQSTLSGKLSFVSAVDDDKGNKKRIEIEDAAIEMTDFADGGLSYSKILAELENVVSGIPLSPIDHIAFKIRDAFREEWDNEYSANPQYVVEEITKRSLIIAPRYHPKKEGEKAQKRFEDGSFIVMNPSAATTKEKVARFNRGATDVIILKIGRAHV